MIALKNLVIISITSSKNMQYLSLRTINATNAKLLTLVAWITALIKQNVIDRINKILKNLSLKSSFAVSAPQLVSEQVLQTVPSMEPTISSSNANFAAPSLSGSAGAIHISVNRATKNK